MACIRARVPHLYAPATTTSGRRKSTQGMAYRHFQFCNGNRECFSTFRDVGQSLPSQYGSDQRVVVRHVLAEHPEGSVAALELADNCPKEKDIFFLKNHIFIQDIWTLTQDIVEHNHGHGEEHECFENFRHGASGVD